MPAVAATVVDHGLPIVQAHGIKCAVREVAEIRGRSNDRQQRSASTARIPYGIIGLLLGIAEGGVTARCAPFEGAHEYYVGNPGSDSALP